MGNFGEEEGQSRFHRWGGSYRVWLNKGEVLAALQGPSESLRSREKSGAMFLGEYEHTIDSKGRMAVPAKFRGQMDRGAVLSKGMGRCLSIYTLARWEEKSARLVEGKNNEELRDFERRIYPSANEIELDGQGRLMIPTKLREYAGLTAEVTVAGVRDHIEIWDRASWQEYQTRLEAEGNTVPF